MNIKTLLKRGNFYQVFCDTFNEYAQEIGLGDIRITKAKNRLTAEFVSYENLGIITRKRTGLKQLRYMLHEYTVRDNRCKRLLVKLSVICAMMSFGLLGNKYFSIKGRSNCNVLVWPCNRSIRFFNFEEQHVISVVKSGFSKMCFENAVRFRQQNDYEFVPHIISCGNGWFKEKILDGMPLARITDFSSYQTWRELACRYMEDMTRGKISLMNPVEYWNELQKRIEDKIIEITKTKQIESGFIIKEISNIIVEKAIEFTSEHDSEYGIPVSISHGDLQEGNLWVDVREGRLYIIDWETVSRRSIWYDPITLLYNLRRANALTKMMERYEKDGAIDPLAIKIKTNVPNILILCTVILEDIDFYLDELLTLPADYGEQTFDQKMNQLANIQAYLERGFFNDI